MILIDLRCEGCKHLHPNTDPRKMMCDAFQDGLGIPLDYLFQIDPAELPECADGIRFEPIDGVEVAVAEKAAAS